MKLNFLFILIFTTSIVTASSIELKCDIERIKFFPDYHRAIRCSFMQNIPEPDTTISKIISSNYSINALSSVNSTVNYLPQNIANFFPDLIFLEIVNCNLLEVHKKDLENYKKLIRINFSKNKLKIIERNLFEGNNELRYVWLHHNKFTFISANSFDHLTKLDFINLRHNPCTNRSHRAEVNRKNVIKVVRDSYVSCFDKNHFSDDEKTSELMIETEEFLNQIKEMKNQNASDKIYDENFEEISFTEILDKCEQKLRKEQSSVMISNENFQNCEVKFLSCETNLTRIEQNLKNVQENSEKLNQTLHKFIEKSENLELKLKKSEEKVSGLTWNLSNCEEISNSCLKNFSQIDEELKICEQNLTQYRENLNISNIKVQSLGSDLKICYENSSKVTAKLTGISQKLTQSEERNKKLEENLTQVTKISSNLEQNLLIQNKTVEILTKSLEKLTETSLKQEVKYEDNLKTKDAKIIDMQTQIDKKDKRIENLEIENENLKFKIHHLTARNDAQRNEIENLKNELKETKKFVEEHFKVSREIFEHFFDGINMDQKNDGKDFNKSFKKEEEKNEIQDFENSTESEIVNDYSTDESYFSSTTQNNLQTTLYELNDAYFVPADHYDTKTETNHQKKIRKRKINIQLDNDSEETTEKIPYQSVYLESQEFYTNNDEIFTEKYYNTTESQTEKISTPKSSKILKFQNEIREIFENMKISKNQKQENEELVQLLNKLNSALNYTQKFTKNLLKSFTIENKKLKKLLEDSIVTSNDLINQRNFSQHELQILDTKFSKFQQKSVQDIKNLKEINEQQSFDNDVSKFWIIMVAIMIILFLLIICILLMLCYLRSEERYWERDLDKNLLHTINYENSINDIFTVSGNMTFAYDNPAIELTETGVELSDRNENNEVCTTIL